MQKRVYFILTGLIFLSALFSGCFVWSYVKQGYKNFSAYFNTFYNAESAFSKAMTELKMNLREYEINQIAGNAQNPFQISPTSRQNFDLAIAKASKVLQLYPMSEFTEDCLYMIGISYYYEGDNLQGQRKFVEAESTFPKSKRVAEAKMYYGSMLIKGLNFDQGLKQLAGAEALAKKEKNAAVLSKCAEILSDYYVSKGDTLTASAYLDSAAALSKDDQSAIYSCESGNLLMKIGKYDQAAKDYRESWSRARDVRIRFYSRYYLARAERFDRRYSHALDDIAALRSDDKFFQYFPLLEYQRAAVLYDSGEVSTAVQSFQKIDTTYSSDQAATRSAYDLGDIYLRKVGDFQTSLKYFQRCSSHPAVPGVSDKGREMAVTLQDYFIRSYRVSLSDSLYDQARLKISRTDSATRQDSANVDTLYQRAADARRDMAGYYMFRLKVPDSALVSYKIIVRHFPKSRAYPSALYTLGEYYYSAGDTVNGKKYLEDLIKQHPESEFAASATQLLGEPPPPVKIDSSQTDYDKAIEMVNENEPDSALATLRRLASDSKSTIAAQALYATGWLFEHKLRKPDSAFVYYRKLQTEYPSSAFTSQVSLALTGYEQAQIDSAAARQRREAAINDSLAHMSKADTTKPAPQNIPPKAIGTQSAASSTSTIPDSISIYKRRQQLLKEEESNHNAAGQQTTPTRPPGRAPGSRGNPADSTLARPHMLKDTLNH